MQRLSIADDEKKANAYWYWENPNNYRYYHVRLAKDLLGDWVLIKCWGRKGSRLGRIQYDVCDNYQSSQEKIAKLKVIRRRHGYKLGN